MKIKILKNFETFSPSSALNTSVERVKLTVYPESKFCRNKMEYIYRKVEILKYFLQIHESISKKY